MDWWYSHPTTATRSKGGLDEYHLLSNHRITVHGDAATFIVYMQARHFSRPEEMHQAVWDIGGYYTHYLIRTAAGWKIAVYPDGDVDGEHPALDEPLTSWVFSENTSPA
jgi:hypothetical protein